jgi:hypothetical protein
MIVHAIGDTTLLGSRLASSVSSTLDVEDFIDGNIVADKARLELARRSRAHAP